MKLSKTTKNIIILATGLIFMVVLDPTDALDFGTPVLEAAVTLIGLAINNRGAK